MVLCSTCSINALPATMIEGCETYTSKTELVLNHTWRKCQS